MIYSSNCVYSSSCDCSQINVTLSLPQPIEEYEPRACDCDFCSARQIHYLSDPSGTLEISHANQIEPLKQGSEQARFWQCTSCHTVIAVTYDFDSGIQGAVNATLFSKQHTLRDAIAVSPKNLSEEEKLKRWRAMWLKVELKS